MSPDRDGAAAALESVQADWNRAMATWNSAEVAKIYAPEAQLFGSLAALHVGEEGALAYYGAFPTGQSCAAIFDNQSIAVPAQDLIVASGFVTFAMVVGGEARESLFRFTFVLRRTDRWYILAHHSSPVPTSSPAD